MLCRTITLLALLLCHCAAPSLDNRASHDATSLRDASLGVFAAEVRPALSVCSSCHGKQQAPLFMVDNVEVAHGAALGNVNFDDISKSNFLKRIVNDKHNCGDCAETEKKVRSALTAWQAARAASNNKGSGSQTAQRNIITSKLSFDIGKFISEEYSGGRVMLDVTVKPDRDTRSYTLRDLEIDTDGVDIYVKDIRPFINGKWNSKDTAYKDIACAVKTTQQRPSGHVIHAAATSIVPDDFAADNKLSFAIGEVRLAQDGDPSCWSDDNVKDMFTSNIRPIIASNCEKSGCHSSPSQDPERIPDLSSYTVVVSKKNTISAVLQGENENHSARLTELDDSSKQAILDWLSE